MPAFREDCAFSFDNLKIPDPFNGPTLRSILHPGNGTEIAREDISRPAHGQVAPRYTLTNHLWTYLKNYADKHREKGNGFGFGLFGPE